MGKKKMRTDCDSYCGEYVEVLVDAPDIPELYYSRKKGEKFYCDTCKRDRAIKSILNKKWWKFW